MLKAIPKRNLYSQSMLPDPPSNFLWPRELIAVELQYNEEPKYALYNKVIVTWAKNIHAVCYTEDYIYRSLFYRDSTVSTFFTLSCFFCLSLDLNKCRSPGLCQNGGTCINTGPDQHRCDCPPGYMGDDCGTGELFLYGVVPVYPSCFWKEYFESSLFSDNLEPSTHFLEGLIVSLQCTIIILTIFVIYK